MRRARERPVAAVQQRKSLVFLVFLGDVPRTSTPAVLRTSTRRSLCTGGRSEPFGVAGRDPHLSAQGDQRSSRHHGLHDLVLGCVMAVSLVVSGLDKLLGLLALDR